MYFKHRYHEIWSFLTHFKFVELRFTVVDNEYSLISDLEKMAKSSDDVELKHELSIFLSRPKFVTVRIDVFLFNFTINFHI